jgi:hypothetical protein
MIDNIEVVKFQNEDTFATLAELANSIAKAVPDLMFKPTDYHTYNVDKTSYPKGLCRGMEVFHSTDPNNHIGKIGIEGSWAEPKYNISSINITDGRNSYGIDGQFKSSIHAKNIVRVAKKVFKPFTFDQIAQRCSRNFTSHIDNIKNNAYWQLRSATCSDISLFIDDFENLYHMGYQPKSPKIAEMMEHIVQNKEKIDKYHEYNPNHYFVIVKDNEVQYRLNIALEKIAITVPNKDALPDDIKGKLFVLDITNKQDFVEDVGLKENDGAYWIIA